MNHLTYYDTFPSSRRLCAVKSIRKRLYQGYDVLTMLALDTAEDYAEGRDGRGSMRIMLARMDRHISMLRHIARDGITLRLAECARSALLPDPISIPAIIGRLSDIDQMIAATSEECAE